MTLSPDMYIKCSQPASQPASQSWISCAKILNKMLRMNFEYYCVLFSVSIFLLLLQTPSSDSSSSSSTQPQIRPNYYHETCPGVESIVRSAVKKKLQETFTTAPGTLRLFFHDCFVQGCDASVLLASPRNDAERDSQNDISLAGDGFDTVARAKAALDTVPRCRHKVSCADILAMAARDVVALIGGPDFEVELGRKDGRISTRGSVGNHLPAPHFNFKQLTSMFASHGLTQLDLIALSGAHTIGFSHCSFFKNRIYGGASNKIDPTLNQAYASELRKMCPMNVDPRIAVPMDPTSPRRFDNAYFSNILKGKGLFTSDQSLLGTSKSRRIVTHFANNGTLFEHAFVTAMTRLGRVGVKIGDQGEIRHNCALVN